jgi:gliding motility-associated-like protein
MKYRVLKTNLLILVLFWVFQVNAQLSKKHYIPPLTSAEFGNANPENQYFYISTPSAKNVTYTIRLVGQPSSSNISGIVSNTNPVEILLGTGYGQLFVESRVSSIVQNDKGYIIEAEDVIYVSLRLEAGGNAAVDGDSPQAGALVSKGLSALGNTFRVGAFTNENPQSNYANFVSIMATENSTSVTFDDLPAGLSIKNYSGTFPITISLDEGESYTIVTNSSENTINRDGLIGALIKSDKPIVVNNGSANGSFHNGGGRDYGIDQIVDFSKVGSEYIFVKGEGNNSWENVLIVAHEDNTAISINGNTTTATINAGEYYTIEGTAYSANGNMYVATSKNVFAYQGIGANGSEANQGMIFVPPLSCENRGNVNNIPNIQFIGNIAYQSGVVTIITNKNATVTVNSQPITALPQDVTGNVNYVTYKVIGAQGNVSVESTGELYCAYYNFNGAATSGSFYSGFPSAPEINLDTNLDNLGTCIPNVTLSATNVSIFDQFEWFFDDGSGYTTTGNMTSNHAPSQPGNYKLIGTINCSGLQFESIEIPVSICPDDYDNDGIIDNKDIDLDNDGILNCDEGKGNVTMNITDIIKPTLLFSDGTTNSTIAKGSFTQSNINGNDNTFIGQNNGAFVATNNAANTSNLKYTLDFTEPVNFNFSETTGTIHTHITGEFFTLKIGPSNKNITLLDPDNQLLVDTNFDGIFESGILDFSASEIRFKFNPTATGNTSFQFVAHQIKQLSFGHHLSNLTENSVFNGTISLTCFDIDTDNDGIVDSLDLDADNDGVPDLVEKNGTYVTLLKTDANADGLDDVFDSTQNAKDTDNDGVFDFIDVDADNDGIFDIEESGHGLLDANFDGMIDNAIALIGMNGLVNSLETNTDSGILNYLITDTDTDALFNFLELDSDNDTCNDVIEAGFKDLDEDGYLGSAPIVVDVFGKIINTSDGYTSPNVNYLISAPILLNSPFEDVIFCESSSASLTIDTNAETFQWQISTDGINWNAIIDDSIYSGANTKSLSITTILISYNAHQFRVKLGKAGNSCEFTSNSIIITVNPKPELVSIPVYEQCDIDNNPIDGITLFNLSLKEAELTNNASNRIVDFFETSDVNYTAPILTKNAYTNSISTLTSNHKLVVRVTNTTSGCITFGELALKVNPSSLDDYPDIYLSELDANADNSDARFSEGTRNAFYNFDTKTTDIINNSGGAFSLTTHIFEYYRTANDAALQTNQLLTPFDDDLFLNNADVFVRISNIGTNACSGIGQFKIFINIRPTPAGNTTPQYLCVNNPIDNPQLISIDLHAETGVVTDTYKWYLNGNLISGAISAVHKANVEGTYRVEAYRVYLNEISDTTDDSETMGYNTFDVLESNKALIITTDITDNLDNPEENNLRIKVSGIGAYQYALNSSNIADFTTGTDNLTFTFNQVKPGLNTVYIRDINGCGITVSQKLSFLFFQRHFSPNNDGILDTWRILGANNSFYKSARVEIFDRYGKVVALITNKNSNGWNGTYNGNKLPSNDYWFNAVLEDINGNVRKETGHFSLLRK